MLDIIYETFASNAEKLEVYLKDFEANRKGIKKILETIPTYWVSTEAEEYYNRYRNVKDEPEELKTLAKEIATRMRELCDTLGALVDTKLRNK